ncbi:MBOAT family O-acyltransferase [Candidatus Electronema sp. JC]|uniref:MBOAT family O-acyltransferase n=1 Tax=Candidatus Electronema sp. JC TaxID=3401570 RepID=UPI003B42F5BC
MLFNSPAYIFLFLPAAVLLYFLLNRWRFGFAASAWLVLASLFFYGCWNPAHLPLLLLSIIVNFALGTMLQQAGRSGKFGLARRVILPFGICFNLGLLGYYKYADFFLANFNSLLGAALPLPQLALPLAISFFTFQQIAYLVDCGRENAKEYDFLNYCLFVTFFPQLVAGPIVHHQEMMPQFARLRNRLPAPRNMALGLFFFSLGLFKKVWIADQFSVWAGTGFAANNALTFFDAWGASLSYTFQLYFDFSGYSDMAVGAALFCNIVLPVNFDSPYQAASIQDFWRRWHITLSRWLRDYLYIPLGGSRKGLPRTCLNLFVTFLLGGLWHGAGWTFVLWGGLHGAALVVHRLWQERGLRLPVVLGWLCTFLFVNASWVIFRAANLEDGLGVLKGMIGLNGIVFSAGMTQLLEQISPLRGQLTAGTLLLPGEMRWHLLAFAAVLFLLPNSCRIGGLLQNRPSEKNRILRRVLRFRPNLGWAVLTGLLFSCALYRMLRAAPSEFLYFNF